MSIIQSPSEDLAPASGDATQQALANLTGGGPPQTVRESRHAHAPPVPAEEPQRKTRNRKFPSGLAYTKRRTCRTRHHVELSAVARHLHEEALTLTAETGKGAGTTDTGKFLWASEGNLAWTLGCCRNSIHKAIAELLEGGWLEIPEAEQREGQCGTNAFRVMTHAEVVARMGKSHCITERKRPAKEGDDDEG
jgi:hypothetical protein